MNKINDLTKVFNKLVNDSVNGIISEKEIFRLIGDLDSEYLNFLPYEITVEGVLSNIGFDIGSLKILSFALKRISKKHKIIPNDKYHYDLGDILLNINLIKIGKEPSIANLINAKEYKLASKNFLLVKQTDNDLYLRAKTNYANILEKYGRNFEAIMNYQSVLKIDNSFGMAAGNLAIALLYYIKLIPSKQKPLPLLNHKVLNY